MNLSSFCLWHEKDGRSWEVVMAPGQTLDASQDGSSDLLWMLDDVPSTYSEWAAGYYETVVPVETVQLIYKHTPLNQQLVSVLNSEISVKDLEDDARQIGYPIE
jgi:hypothetical protein